ncbi:MAG: DUF2314 domain-containing protein [Phycisphaerales bacterium]
MVKKFLPIVIVTLLIGGAAGYGWLRFNLKPPPDSASPTQPTPLDVDPESGVVFVKDEDAEMNAAIAESRRTVAEFITAFNDPCVACGSFSVKQRYDTPDGGSERIWIEVQGIENNQFVGVIGNDPVKVPDLKIDDKVRVQLDEISDWMYLHDGEVVGGRTIKLLCDRATPEERASRFGNLRFRAAQPAAH